jgi:sirohydrochlorin cobaltochelatase
MVKSISRKMDQTPTCATECHAMPSCGFPPGLGVLVVGHGTADPVGASETRAVTDRVASLLPGVPVTLGFLEVIGPDLPEALGVLAAAGCREIVVAPLLLFEAGHAKRDIPEAIRGAAAAQGMVVRQAQPLGCHPAIVALARQRRWEAGVGDGAIPMDATTLVVVGRGSSDPSARASLENFTAATLVGDPLPHRLLLGFAAAARPSLAEAIDTAGDPSDHGVRRILVQPHLLFRGHVEDQVVAAIDGGRARRPDLEWVRVARLGPDPLVAAAVVARAADAAAFSGPKSPRQTDGKSSQ